MKNKTLKAIIGLTLMPGFAALFFIDRFILVAFFWLPAPTLLDFFNKWEHIRASAIRVAAMGIFYGLLKLIGWM